MRNCMRYISVILCLALLCACCFAAVEGQGSTLDMSDTLRQVGNQLYNGRGQAVRLLGTNVPHYGWTGAGPALDTGDNIVDLALGEWQSNVIRFAIKPSYWNNGVYKLKNNEPVLENGQPVQLMTAEQYRSRVDAVVAKVASQGKYLLLDNHSFYLPGQDSVLFWESAAARYKNHPNVIFGLFNEPANCSWEQWKNGGHISFQGTNDWGAFEDVEIDSKGMQHLLDTVRATGAKNVVTVSGLTWGYDLTYVTTTYKLTDTSDSYGMVYETHIYPERDPDYDTCFGIAAAEYPILVGECGPIRKGKSYDGLKDPIDQAYMKKLIQYMDKYELHLTAWSLGSSPHLLGSGNKPTAYGKMMKDYIAKNLKEKSVTLYNKPGYKGGSLSLTPGTYTAADIKAMGFDLSQLASLASKNNAYQYSFTFAEKQDGGGRTYTLVNGAKNVNDFDIRFTPKALIIERFTAVNILENNKKVTITTVNAQTEELKNLIDGTDNKWESTMEGPQTLLIKLGQPYMLTGISLMHASKAGELDAYNTSDYTVSLSDNGKVYTLVASAKNNALEQTNHLFDPVVATHIKITILSGNMLDPARACLAEIAAYGVPYKGELSQLPAQIQLKQTGENVTNAQPEATLADDETLETESTLESLPTEETIDSTAAATATTNKTEPEELPAGKRGGSQWILIVCIIGAVCILGAGGLLLYLFKFRKKSQ